MAEGIKQKIGFVVAAMMVVSAVAALNLGTPAGAQAQECDPDGGGNETESPSPSPSESGDPFPPSIPPIIPEESESTATPTPTDTGAAARRCDSHITINYRGPNRKRPERREFAGRVKSAEDACERGRKVLVKKNRRGKRDVIVDTTVTNHRGTWRVPARRANGRYYAKTPQEKVPTDRGRVTCRADRSKGIRV